MALTKNSATGLGLLLVFSFVIACGGAAVSDDPCAPDCAGVEGYFPHPQDCTLYYQCSQGTPVLQTCPGGLYYSPITQACDYPDHAGCTADPNFDCGGSATTPSSATTTVEQTTTAPITAVPSTTAEQTTTAAAETTTAAAETTTAERTTTSKPITDAPTATPAQTTVDETTTAVPHTTGVPESTTSGGSGTTDPSECVPPCPSDEALYPNPRNCSTFFHCAYGVPYLQACPPDQEYSLMLERCDWPEIADCTASDDTPCVAVTKPPGYH